MNGLGLPSGQPSVRELREQLAMAEALEPIQRENLDAKQAYRAALDSGDQAEIAAARQRKQAAAHQVNETRTWLRREARIARLHTEIAALEERLVSREDADLRVELEVALAALDQELETLELEAAPLRELFAAAGPPVVVEDGTVRADAPTVTVKATTMKGGK